MKKTILKEVDSSVHNVIVLLCLLHEKEATAYRMAQKIKKPLNEGELRKACKNLVDFELLKAIKDKERGRTLYSIDYGVLVSLFFNHLWERMNRKPTEEDYLTFQEFFSSKTVSTYAERFLEVKMKKNYLSKFFQLVFLFLYVSHLTSIFNKFHGDIFDEQLRKMRVSKKQITKIYSKSQELGFDINEMADLMPKVLKSYITLFQLDPYTKQIREILQDSE